MCLVKYYVLIFFALFLDCYALNCRSDGSGPKEEELKTIYMNCLKKQDGRNSSNNRGSPRDITRKEPRGYNQKSQWDGEDDRLGRDRDDRVSRDDRVRNRDDRIRSIDDRISARDDRISSRDDKMGGRNDRMGVRNDMMGTGFGRSDNTNGRDDFPQSDEFGSFSSRDMAYNPHRSSTQAPRRFKREKHMGMSSGQRSQYNPNAPSKRPGYADSYRNDEKNSSENSSNKDENKKACALHCFLENLEMIGDNSMPDRYLVTHAITKDVKNEDLRDFLQESIEECFQILDNENTEDKCEFSKNLLMCLSEKGRANCDDWKDDFKF